MAKQRLFVAVLVLQSRVGDRDDNPIVDHQVRIVRAASAATAYTRALRLGAAEHSTTWEFLGLSELDHLREDQLDDGGEVFSWRTQGPGREFVKEKEQLAVFAPSPGRHPR